MKLLFKETLTKEAVTTLEDYSYKNNEIHFETMQILHIFHVSVRTKGYSTDLLDPTQVESKKCSQIQWPVPSINAEPVDIFLGEE